MPKAIYFNPQNTRVDGKPRSAKRGHCREKCENFFMNAFHKTKPTQKIGSLFAQNLEKLKKTKCHLV